MSADIDFKARFFFSLVNEVSQITNGNIQSRVSIYFSEVKDEHQSRC